jgi:hypothetical protein
LCGGCVVCGGCVALGVRAGGGMVVVVVVCVCACVCVRVCGWNLLACVGLCLVQCGVIEWCLLLGAWVLSRAVTMLLPPLSPNVCF